MACTSARWPSNVAKYWVLVGCPVCVPFRRSSAVAIAWGTSIRADVSAADSVIHSEISGGNIWCDTRFTSLHKGMAKCNNNVALPCYVGNCIGDCNAVLENERIGELSTGAPWEFHQRETDVCLFDIGIRHFTGSIPACIGDAHGRRNIQVILHESDGCFLDCIGRGQCDTRTVNAIPESLPKNVSKIMLFNQSG